MGLLDKIKNALFEVEYVEVDEVPKQKKVKEKKEKEDKPIAKKIVLPGKKEEKVEELHEEELKDEDFEIRPKDEMVKEKSHDDFKIMDDNDFKMEEDIEVETPEILQVLDENEEISSRVGKHASVEEESFTPEPVQEEKKELEEKIEQLEDYYQPSYHASDTRESKPYGLDNSYNVPVHPYGGYERREEKSYFKPSPIISPIYGILDKNYKKEDVKEKKEVRLSSSVYGRNLNVDDIRNKAYGDKKEAPVEEKKVEVEEDSSSKFEVEEEEDNLLVDLSDRTKPEVKELTMGDAMEYFQDLGLEYNVDYVDVSKEKAIPKKVQEEPIKDENAENVLAEDIEDATSKIPVEETKQALKKDDNIEDDNDNLFDLIDSMYQEKD